MSAAPKMPLGKIIDEMKRLRDIKRDLNSQIKDLDEEYEELKTMFLQRMDAEGTTQSRGHTASATVTENIVPNVKDWDAVEAYIRENDAFYMMQRRINTGAYKELIEAGEELPGIETFTKRDVSLRSI